MPGELYLANTVKKKKKKCAACMRGDVQFFNKGCEPIVEMNAAEAIS